MNKRPERTWDYKIRGFYKDKENSTKGLDMPNSKRTNDTTRMAK